MEIALRLFVWMILMGTAPLWSKDGGFDPALLRNGDIVFQTSRSGQSLAIQLATRSPYSHCGIVYIKNGKPYVFEASTEVKKSPFKRFVKKGEGGKFVIKRLRNADSLLTRENLKLMEQEGKKFEGRPYDSYFGWADDRIYCSELVYKIYLNALGVQVGRTAKLKSFDLTDARVQAKLKERYGAEIPMEEIVISPAAQFEDPNLVKVYTNW
jgi:cell wall-associated NlpC family hydrolase